MSHLPASIPLWPKNVPGALGELPEDIPTLTAYLPEDIQTPCAAFVICPGGAYGGLDEHEGEGYAKWLNQQGIAGLVLKYRHPVMLNDAASLTVDSKNCRLKMEAASFGIFQVLK